MWVSIGMGLTIAILITMALCYIAREKCQKRQREYYVTAQLTSLDMVKSSHSIFDSKIPFARAIIEHTEANNGIVDISKGNYQQTATTTKVSSSVNNVSDLNYRNWNDYYYWRPINQRWRPQQSFDTPVHTRSLHQQQRVMAQAVCSNDNVNRSAQGLSRSNIWSDGDNYENSNYHSCAWG